MNRAITRAASVDEEPYAWKPSEKLKANARVSAFLKQCNLDTFELLYRRSIEDVAWFTEAVIDFLEIEFDPPYHQVLDLSEGVEWARWCVGGGLNVSRMCVDRHRVVRARAPAIIWEGEGGETQEMSYAELAEDVEQCAAGLRSLGLGKGVAIGVHLPMLPQAAIALVAIARVGGIAVPLFSGFGAEAITTRLRDVGASALITYDTFRRRGQSIPGKLAADAACAALPTIRHLIVVTREGGATDAAGDQEIYWDDLLANGRDASASLRDPEPTNSEDFLMVLYSSGTTGGPKGIVHTHCGFPIKAAQDMALGTDVGPGTRILWITDIGWMMGPWVIYGALILGATIVLYEGAPDYPDPDRMWSVCERHGVEVLGVAPTLVRVLMGHGDAASPRSAPPVSLRVLASTGEPWSESAWWWLFDRVGGRSLPIINYSGGTEIAGGILMGSPLLPVKPCAFPASCPGIDARVLDADGIEVREGVGELVIQQPWIGMARGFWGDPGRYLETYWSRWPGVWVQGDWARIDADGQWFILGRSDDTLKVAGRRIGPAEVESVLLQDSDIQEAAVIGVPDDRQGTAVIGFCVSANRRVDPIAKAAELRERVAVRLGRALRPSKVVLVSELPKTRSGKIMRRVVRATWLGEEPGDLSSLKSSTSIQGIREARTRGDGGDSPTNAK